MSISVDSKQRNDCAIVALSNYFGIQYESVLNELESYAVELGLKWKFTGEGTPSYLSNSFCLKRGLKPIKVPRRGQEKISGIVSMHAANTSTGHLVAMLDGVVFDAFEPDGLSIQIYQKKYRHSHIRRILV